MRYLYTLLFYLALPLIVLRLYWLGRKTPAYRLRWAERFGFFPALAQGGCIWIHAVSLGETRAALPLIRAFQERHPAIPLLVTTMTPTGSQQVTASLGDSVYHVYLPYDLPDAIKRFLLRTKPRLAIIMETEIWPNLLHGCKQSAIPVVIANARLSERSAKGYARFANFTWAMLDNITMVATQSRADAIRFRDLGVPPDRLRVTGNIKYDLALPLGLLERGQELKQTLFANRPVLIAASTHAGEDEIILKAFKSLRQEFAELLLILVPRHPERFEVVAELCQQQNFHLVRRSADQTAGATVSQVFLGDSIGELLLFYAAADVAFVGGSLIPNGGHNILEPALLGVPVVFGPYMHNFHEASEHLLQHQAAKQVTDGEALTTELAKLLRDEHYRRIVGQRAKTAVEANRGALSKLFGVIENLIETETIHSNQRRHMRSTRKTDDAQRRSF